MYGLFSAKQKQGQEKKRISVWRRMRSRLISGMLITLACGVKMASASYLACAGVNPLSDKSPWEKIIPDANWTYAQLNNGDLLFRRTLTFSYSFGAVPSAFGYSFSYAGASAYYSTNDLNAQGNGSIGAVGAYKGAVYMKMYPSNNPSGLVTAHTGNTVLSSPPGTPVPTSIPTGQSWTYTVQWTQEVYLADKSLLPPGGGQVIFGGITYLAGDVQGITNPANKCLSQMPILGDNDLATPLLQLPPVVKPSCTATGGNASIFVKMDAIDSSALASTSVNTRVSSGTPFNIDLDCDPGVTVLMSFVDNATPEGGAQYLRNTNAATKDAVGVQVVQNNMPITFAPASVDVYNPNLVPPSATLLTFTTNNSGSIAQSVSFPFYAYYYRLAGGVVPGDVDASMVVHLYYQ